MYYATFYFPKSFLDDHALFGISQVLHSTLQELQFYYLTFVPEQYSIQ